MSRYSGPLLLGLGLLLGGSCGDDSQSPGQGAIEVGTGALDFETLADHAPLVLVAGTQGGHHLVVNARITGLLPGNPSMPNQLGNPLTSFSLFDETGERIDEIAPPYRLGYRESSEEPWFEMPSGRILRINQDLIDADEGYLARLYESELVIRVSVVDARGDNASHETRIRPAAEPAPDAGLSADAGPLGVDAGP